MPEDAVKREIFNVISIDVLLVTCVRQEIFKKKEIIKRLKQTNDRLS